MLTMLVLDDSHLIEDQVAAAHSFYDCFLNSPSRGHELNFDLVELNALKVLDLVFVENLFEKSMSVRSAEYVLDSAILD